MFNKEMEELQNPNLSDHDLLNRLDTKFDLLHEEVRRGNDDTKERLTLLGANKVEKEEFHQWQVTHEKETAFREEALRKSERENSEAIKALTEGSIKDLQDSVTKQGRWITYVAGGLFVFGILLSILGPVISAAIAKLFHLN